MGGAGDSEKYNTTVLAIESSWPPEVHTATVAGGGETKKSLNIKDMISKGFVHQQLLCIWTKCSACLEISPRSGIILCQ